MTVLLALIANVLGYEKVLENLQSADVQSVSGWYLCFCHMACHPLSRRSQACYHSDDHRKIGRASCRERV